MPTIHPSAVVHESARLGSGVEVGPLCFVGENVTLGDGCKLVSHVSIPRDTTLGQGNLLFPQAVVGVDPQDLTYAGERVFLEIGDGNHIRESVSIHRGTDKETGVTRVGSRNLLMAYCHIAHDCIIGSDLVIGNGTQVAGHCTIKDHAHIAGMTGIHQFVTIGEAAYIGGMSRIMRDVPPYGVVEGRSAQVRKINTMLLKKLGASDETVEKLRLAHRLLFRRHLESDSTPLPLQQACDRVRELYADDEHVQTLLGAVEEAASTPTGRYRQHHKPPQIKSQPTGLADSPQSQQI